MTRDRVGDTNRKYKILLNRDACLSRNDEVMLRPPRGFYRLQSHETNDNPVNGTGLKEPVIHFMYLENRCMRSEFDFF